MLKLQEGLAFAEDVTFINFVFVNYGTCKIEQPRSTFYEMKESCLKDISECTLQGIQVVGISLPSVSFWWFVPFSPIYNFIFIACAMHG